MAKFPWARGVRTAGLAVTLLLGGCLAGLPLPFQSEVWVTRHHALGPSAGGYSFAMKATGDLESDQQAAVVARHLQQLGFRPAAESEAADLTVRVGYSAEDFVYSYSKPIFVEVGGGQQRITSKIYGPDLFPQTITKTVDVPSERRWVGTRLVTDVAFGRVLRVVIRRGEQRVFDGRAISSGDTAAEAAGRDCLIAAMFRDFPGRNGETVKTFYPRGRCPPA